MLLFMIQADLDDRDDFAQIFFVTAFKKCIDAFIHTRAVFENIIDGRSGDHAALRAAVHRPRLLVVRVEEKIIARVDRLVSVSIGIENKAFKEPGGVRKVPLNGTGVGLRLNDHILDGQRLAKPLGKPAHLMKTQFPKPGVCIE